MTIRDSGSSSCGGGTPYDFVEHYTYDVRTGGPLDLSAIFREWDGATGRPTLAMIDWVIAAYRSDPGYDADHAAWCVTAEYLSEGLDINFAQDDIAVFSTVDVADANCTGPVIAVPLDNIRDLLADNVADYFPSLASSETSRSSAAGVDCTELVAHYHAERADHPTDGMPTVFPMGQISERLSYDLVRGNIQSSTELTCDRNGKVERFRFAFSWQGERDPDKTGLTMIAMIVLASPVSPGSGLITDLFERAEASMVTEQEDVPGPYFVAVEISPVTADGGVMTLLVERDEQAMIRP